MSTAEFSVPAPGVYLVKGPEGAIELSTNQRGPVLIEHAAADVHGAGLDARTPCTHLPEGCWRCVVSILGMKSYLKAYRADDQDVLKPWLLEEYAGMAALVRRAQQAATT